MSFDQDNPKPDEQIESVCPKGGRCPLGDGPKSGHLTTAQAAIYLGLAGPSSVRSLVQRGELTPVGRRGRTGPYLFRVTDLDAWILGCLPPHLYTKVLERHWTAGVVRDPTIRGINDQDQTISGALSTPGRTILHSRDGQEPTHQQDASNEKNTREGRHTRGGSNRTTKTEDETERRRSAHQSSKEDVRERLRRAVDRAKGKKGATPRD